MDPESIVKATTETAKAANKFAELIQRFKGPKWTRKQADADTYADEKKLQTIRDNPDMEIVYVDGKLNARERTPEALAFRAQQRQIADSVRKEKNIENVLQFAANEITQIGDEPVSDAPIDDDWITRFFDITEDISSEDLQFIWGKILTGEIKQPGSFSLRTLDVLRNLSKTDAKVFQEIASFMLISGKEKFILSDSELLESFGVRYGFISLLDDCGLIDSTPLVSITFTISPSKPLVIYNDKYVIQVNSLEKDTIKISLGIHGLTRAGTELFNILDAEADYEYVLKVAEMILTKGNVKTSVHKVNYITDDAINYVEKPLKEFEKN